MGHHFRKDESLVAPSYYHGTAYSPQNTATLADLMMRGPEAYAQAIREAAAARAHAAQVAGQGRASIAASLGTLTPQIMAAKLAEDQRALETTIKMAQLEDMRAQAKQREAAANAPIPVTSGTTLIDPKTRQPIYSAPNRPMPVGAGGTLVDPDTHQPIFTAPTNPINVPQGGTLIDPTTHQPIYTAPARAANSQEAEFRLNGKDVKGDYIPGVNGQPGKYFYNGDDVTAKITKVPSVAAVQLQAGTGLSDTALDQAAQKYLDTGTLPPGYGAVGIQRQNAIMNRAGVMDPQAALARNQAIYKADAANLTNLQRTEGSLSAFESSAGKNLDMFLTLIPKMPDTGVPWLNKPVRTLTKDMVGDEFYPAVQAARAVALREIARVTNDPKLSGQLTDSARREVEGLAPENATLGQIKHVAEVLKQDMANVHTGLTEQMDAIKARISGGTSGGTWIDLGGGVRVRQK